MNVVIQARDVRHPAVHGRTQTELITTVATRPKQNYLENYKGELLEERRAFEGRRLRWIGKGERLRAGV